MAKKREAKKKKSKAIKLSGAILKANKRRTAFHEAGHLVVASVMGQDVSAALTYPEDGILHDTTNVGEADTLFSSTLPSVAIAGYIAVEMVQLPEEVATDHVHYEIALNSGDINELSETDRLAFGTDRKVQAKAIKDAIAILQANKEFLLWAWKTLIKEEHISNGEVFEYTRSHPVVLPKGIRRRKRNAMERMLYFMRQLGQACIDSEAKTVFDKVRTTIKFVKQNPECKGMSAATIDHHAAFVFQSATDCKFSELRELLKVLPRKKQWEDVEDLRQLYNTHVKSKKKSVKKTPAKKVAAR